MISRNLSPSADDTTLLSFRFRGLILRDVASEGTGDYILHGDIRNAAAAAQSI